MRGGAGGARAHDDDVEHVVDGARQPLAVDDRAFREILVGMTVLMRLHGHGSLRSLRSRWWLPSRVTSGASR
jgi:hypothetical protein